MSLFRVMFLFYYGDIATIKLYPLQTVNSLFLGFRLDLTVVGYIQALPTLFLILCHNSKLCLEKSIPYLKIYLFITYLIVSILLLTDFAFFSFFKEHINLLIFGIIDDDVSALMVTIWKNYPIVLVSIFFTIFLYLLWKSIQTTVNNFPNLAFQNKITNTAKHNELFAA